MTLIPIIDKKNGLVTLSQNGVLVATIWRDGSFHPASICGQVHPITAIELSDAAEISAGVLAGTFNITDHTPTSG